MAILLKNGVLLMGIGASVFARGWHYGDSQLPHSKDRRMVLIDILNGNRVYVPSLIVLNKIDLVNQGFIREVQSKIGDNFIPISADANVNIDGLRNAIYEKLDFIRIYMRPKGQNADYNEPMIMRNGCTVKDLCNKVHRSMTRDFRFALVWGKSAKFDGQKVGLDHKLVDEDVITIVRKVNAI